jgi:protein TonB
VRPRTFFSLTWDSWTLSLGAHLFVLLALFYAGRSRTLDLTVINLDLPPLAQPSSAAKPLPVSDEEWRKPEVPRRFPPPPPKKLEIKSPPPAVFPPAPAPPASEGGTGSSSYRSIAQVSQVPQYHIDIPESEYPEAAIQANVEGTVILQIYWDAAGKVQKVEVLKGLGYGFEELAIKHVMKTVFTPAYAGGEPVPYKGQIPFRFNLKTPGY